MITHPLCSFNKPTIAYLLPCLRSNKRMAPSAAPATNKHPLPSSLLVNEVIGISGLSDGMSFPELEIVTIMFLPVLRAPCEHPKVSKYRRFQQPLVNLASFAILRPIQEDNLGQERDLPIQPLDESIFLE